MSTKTISTVEEFEELLTEHDQFLFLKNSLTCPISQAAYEEYQQFANNHDEFPTYHLHVQDSRPLSNHIAENFNIKHESPQALLFKDKTVTWNTSHWKITSDTLSKAISE
ncbi:bacillithiol system redox-active protein YtxJ [Metabacillus litoralis]|uniref:Bacillithiol system redox-active protein YtxJ n=1 Tax=Metabacillus litoralis TaxID=152268 RepID=A0A5C6VY60_9BACI|nr:bacillithiol system redox-active protein YtxJ [Metabacillus litoralis]TXC90242.1 bacillithiol system redox-active protein YtxJ [Metabacillus litoralis]